MDITKKRVEKQGMQFVDYTEKIEGRRFCVWMEAGYSKEKGLFEILMRIAPLDMVQGAFLEKIAEKIARVRGAVFETKDLGFFTESNSPDVPQAYIHDVRKVFTLKMSQLGWGPYSGNSKTKEGQREIQEVKEKLIAIVRDFFERVEKAAEFTMHL